MNNIQNRLTSICKKVNFLRIDYDMTIEEVVWIDHLIGKIEFERSQTGNARAKMKLLSQLNAIRAVQIQNRELIKKNIRVVERTLTRLQLE